MKPETVARLAGHTNIHAIKEALGDRQRVPDLLRLCGEDLIVLSGDDGSCMEAMRKGASGVISVAGNVAPAHMSRLTRASIGGDEAHASELQNELSNLFDQLAVETNPIPVKWAAFRMGLIGPGIRLPLLPLEPGHHAGMETCLRELGLIATDKITTIC
jgi:4-hydroxy-tetrahydrodipicolinate synthase